MMFTGGEIKHDPSCYFYPESLSKLYDDLKGKQVFTREQVCEIALAFYKYVEGVLPDNWKLLYEDFERTLKTN